MQGTCLYLNCFQKGISKSNQSTIKNLNEQHHFTCSGHYNGYVIRTICIGLHFSGAPARAKRAWDRAPYSWNMVNLFSFGCHVIDQAYVRTYASTDCTGGVGEAIKRKGGVSQGFLGKSTSFME